MPMKNQFNTINISVLVLVAISIFSQVKVHSLQGDIVDFKNEIDQGANEILKLQTNLASTSKALDAANTDRNDLSSRLEEQQKRGDTLNKQVSKITRTVNKLEKLTQTDKELLQKYSKVYFLNEHYVPEALENIKDQYVYDKTRQLQIHSEVQSFLEDMLDDAIEDNVDIKVISAYRSFNTQAQLKSGYKVTYGTSAANQFSADQGYSEHQLGTTLDFTTASVGASFTNFEKTPAYTWLNDNAYRYGFILSYPKQNSYYQFEPWHWRFVGVDLARYLHRNNINFYNMDQREIDDYLGRIFDN